VNELIQFDLNFASFEAPYNPVRLMYDKRPANIQRLILRLMVRKIRYNQLHDGILSDIKTLSNKKFHFT